MDIKAEVLKYLVEADEPNPQWIHNKAHVTPSYAQWMRNQEQDPVLCTLSDTTCVRSVPGRHAVDDLIGVSVQIVTGMIHAGVPREIALRLLPHELYEKIVPH